MHIHKKTIIALHELYDDFKSETKCNRNCNLEDHMEIAENLRDTVINKYKLNVTYRDLPKSVDDIWMSFNDSRDFDEFLSDLFFDKGNYGKSNIGVRLKNRDSVHTVGFPENRRDGNYQKAIENIKKVLINERPLALQRVCVAERIKKNCDGFLHTIIISGYRTICNKKGKCFEQLKVVNSWGKPWQDSHDDGWVNAKPLLDSTFYEMYSLMWLEDKK